MFKTLQQRGVRPWNRRENCDVSTVWQGMQILEVEQHLWGFQSEFDLISALNRTCFYKVFFSLSSCWCRQICDRRKSYVSKHLWANMLEFKCLFRPQWCSFLRIIFGFQLLTLCWRQFVRHWHTIQWQNFHIEMLCGCYYTQWHSNCCVLNRFACKHSRWRDDLHVFLFSL